MKSSSTASWIKKASFSAGVLILLCRSYALRELFVLTLLLAVVFLVIAAAITVVLIFAQAARAAGRSTESRSSPSAWGLQTRVAKVRAQRPMHRSHPAKCTSGAGTLCGISDRHRMP
jgi:hypothetical protein